jgi:SAM-dependent methyltransferase/uncharacterized protein YbaR (Trm112 family)
MRAFLRRNLCCPLCKGALDLEILCGSQEDVEDGLLRCAPCRVMYPILDRVPVMLTYVTRAHAEFRRRYPGAFSGANSFDFAHGVPPEGERHVQQSFSQEWEGLTDDALTFALTADELYALHRNVYLNVDEDDYAHEVRVVLNVGCGAGKESEILQQIFPQAEVIAIDINFSVLSAPRRYARNMRLHFVLASVFALPFRNACADQVFAQGVIHHTHSTKEAFDALVPMVKGGGHLFVWVYGKDDYLAAPHGSRTLALMLWGMEMVLRPIICRLPAAPQKAAVTTLALMTYLPARSRLRHRQQWRLKNEVHACFDKFAPRYAWRHGANEVTEWFENAGFICRYQSPRKFRALFGRRIFGTGINGYLPRARPTAPQVSELVVDAAL